MRLSELEAKNVLLWGAGREATAFVHAMESRGVVPRLTIADEQGGEGRTVKGHPVTLLTDELVDAADVIVRSPGVSIYRQELQRSLDRGVVVTTATNLWFGEPHAPVIGVTGTKGKSTTSSLITHLLCGVGVKAALAGNIGRSPLEMLDDPQPDWWVLELSSYQTSDLSHSPEIAVLTNLSPEHLDWHGEYEIYVADKLRLFANEPRVSIVNVLDPEVVRLARDLPSRVEACVGEGVHFDDGAFWCGSSRLFARNNLRLSGAHNEQLLCLALAAVQQAGVDIIERAEELAGALESFEPLPHRLNPVGEHAGVLYVNDSLSTTPVASIAAMEAFGERQITLLAGGFDRGLDYGELAAYVGAHSNVKVVTLPESGSRIAPLIRSVAEREDVVYEAADLAGGVSIAAGITPPGGAVLLSPGAPSFGAFKDYAERGDAFAQYVLSFGS